MNDTLDLSWGIYRRIYSGGLRGRRINSVPVRAECMFWRLNLIADDYGNFEADPCLVKANAFPLRKEITERHIETDLVSLSEKGSQLIALYMVGEERYGHIIDFEKYQPPNRNGRRIRRFPAFPRENANVVHFGESGGIRGSPTQSKHSDSDSDSDSDSEETPIPPAGDSLLGFKKFWDAWPRHFRKKARTKCEKHWKAAKLESKQELILGSLEAWKCSPQWLKEDGQFIPGPLPWLNNEAWETPMESLGHKVGKTTVVSDGNLMAIIQNAVKEEQDYDRNRIERLHGKAS